jgi:Zn-dependent protease/predicted transcriptional regulator
MHAFRIGRLFGIDIRVDWSWVFIFVLMTWNLSTVFAQWHPAWPSIEPLAVAIMASLLFFTCLLGHELAHSLVATRLGLRVRSITLFLFGGVSNIEQEPASAKVEFWTAVVGPLTSIALGIGFLILGAFVTAFSLRDADSVRLSAAQLGPVATLVVWLGPINIVIGFFNLVPAFPLDGGRVLHAILWAVSGEPRTATRQASAVGQSIGWIFIVAGIAMTFGVRVPFFGTGLAGGLWLAFIGWFVRSSASQAYRRLAIDEALAGHTVEEVMRPNGPVVSPGLSLSNFMHDYLVRSDDRALPVVSDGQLMGLVGLSDMRAVPPAEWPTTPVSSVMRRRASVTVTSPHVPLAEAFAQLAQQDIEQLPVLDGGRLAGMLQRRDIARWLELAWGPIVPPRPPGVPGRPSPVRAP